MEDHAYLLSPARTDGPRARMLMNPSAQFDLAQRLRSVDGAPLGEVFAFLSGLYFRGKIEYARAFTPNELHDSRIRIITSNRGLCSPSDRITVADLVSFSEVDIANADDRYLAPLSHDVETLCATLPSPTGIVLLGSIATGKYVDILSGTFGSRLLFPADFVGRGDMSRGGLLLRHAREGIPLPTIPVLGAARHGKRPPKLGKPGA